jgi:hypothetical protein
MRRPSGENATLSTKCPWPRKRSGSLAQPIRVYRHPGTGEEAHLSAGPITGPAGPWWEVRLVAWTAVQEPWRARRQSTGGGAGRWPRRADASACGCCERRGGCGSIEQDHVFLRARASPAKQPVTRCSRATASSTDPVPMRFCRRGRGPIGWHPSPSARPACAAHPRAARALYG